jgi:hypothetical protein
MFVVVLLRRHGFMEFSRVLTMVYGSVDYWDCSHHPVSKNAKEYNYSEILSGSLLR